MKKRLNEEQTKLQQLEKDYELATSRFQKQQDDMKAEVDAFTAEINKRRAITEDAMKAECKNYANKIYGILNKIAPRKEENSWKPSQESSPLRKTVQPFVTF